MKASFIGTAGGSVTAESPSSSLLIENGGKYLLIDIGSGVVMDLVRQGLIDKVNDVLITHFHADHAADSMIAVHDRLIKMQLGRDVDPIRFWTPEGPKAEELVMGEYSSRTCIAAGESHDIAGLHVELYNSEHPVPCLSVKVSDGKHTLYYTSDGALTDDLLDNVKGSDVIIAECSLYRDIDGKPMGHMNAEDVALLRERTDAEMIYLTHLPVYGNNDELLAPSREKGLDGIRLAEKGLIITLGE